MAFTEDMSVFFNTDDFAIEATWTNSEGDESEITVIFDEAYGEPLGEFEGSTPIVECPTSSVPGIAHGDSLTIDNHNYKVIGVKPDGTGSTVIILEDRGEDE